MIPSARLVGINHVALEVDDLEEAISFYGGPRLFTSWATRAFSR
jgi:predicted enzyme related to lactoylglutathione lyase